ncbi:MAG: MFS transporter [Phycisphaeraceae bacterium]|nr:MFS transporter [Phycisphaeraceae bacterium]
MSWFAFFLCFFAWFGIAPLMTVVRKELSLTHSQIGWCVIGSVAATIFARLFIGWLCDQIGPRRTYTWLLVIGSLPVMGIGLARSFETFLLFRVLIGCIGASFVITQYHTSKMFAPNCIGTANATSAGWGNLGGGVTQMIMPLLFALSIGVFGLSTAMGWRACMIVVGLLCMTTGLAYYKFTQDTPEGNFKDLRASGRMPKRSDSRGAFLQACKDPRVWALFVVYGACFGVELTINNVAALYFLDYFDYFKELPTARAIGMAGLFAGLFGLMNLFARTLGGMMGDRMGMRFGLRGRVRWLFVVLLGEGIALMLFSQMNVLVLAIPMMIIFSLFVQMSEGATYSIVPFVNKKSLGAVSGIVGAGGNAGAVAAGFLFKSELPWNTSFWILGLIVSCVSLLVFAVRFSPAAEKESKSELEAALAIQSGAILQPVSVRAR